MKLLLVSIFIISSISAQAYTRWTAINPFDACTTQYGQIKILTMVNTGAGGLFEFHNFDREFVQCEEIDGVMTLSMNLYHKSTNNMEAGMAIKRSLHTRRVCARTPEVIRFNDKPDARILKNGKFSGPRRVVVKENCASLGQ